MRIQSKWEDTLEAIKKNEEVFVDKIKKGSDNPMDYHYMSYFSGLHNGFNLYWMMTEASEGEFDEQVKKLLQIDEIPNG